MDTCVSLWEKVSNKGADLIHKTQWSNLIWATSKCKCAPALPGIRQRMEDWDSTLGCNTGWESTKHLPWWEWSSFRLCLRRWVFRRHRLSRPSARGRWRSSPPPPAWTRFRRAICWPANNFTRNYSFGDILQVIHPYDGFPRDQIIAHPKDNTKWPKH